ncbi:MAG: Ig-like domain-containing protein, partial [Planktothrix sp.]
MSNYYEVNLTVGNLILTGYIGTNTTSGSLASSNFTDWDITVSNGFSSTKLTPSNSSISSNQPFVTHSEANGLSILNDFNNTQPVLLFEIRSFDNNTRYRIIDNSTSILTPFVEVSANLNGGPFQNGPTGTSVVTFGTFVNLPKVTGVTSNIPNGAYTVGNIIPIAVTFSEPVSVTGTPTLALNTGAIATYVSGSNTNTLTFNYTVAAGQNISDLDYSLTTALNLSGGTIKDAATKNAILTLPSPGAANSLGANKNLIIDTIAPTATTLTPTDNAANVAVGANLVVAFSENVQKGTGNIVIRKVSDNSIAETIDVTSANVTVTGSTVTINPTNDLVDGIDYYVEIAAGAIRDLAGNNFAGITG